MNALAKIGPCIVLIQLLCHSLWGSAATGGGAVCQTVGSAPSLYLKPPAVVGDGKVCFYKAAESTVLLKPSTLQSFAAWLLGSTQWSEVGIPLSFPAETAVLPEELTVEHSDVCRHLIRNELLLSQENNQLKKIFDQGWNDWQSLGTRFTVPTITLSVHNHSVQFAVDPSLSPKLRQKIINRITFDFLEFILPHLDVLSLISFFEEWGNVPSTCSSGSGDGNDGNGNDNGCPHSEAPLVMQETVVNPVSEPVSLLDQGTEATEALLVLLHKKLQQAIARGNRNLTLVLRDRIMLIKLDLDEMKALRDKKLTQVIAAWLHERTYDNWQEVEEKNRQSLKEMLRTHPDTLHLDPATLIINHDPLDVQEAVAYALWLNTRQGIAYTIYRKKLEQLLYSPEADPDLLSLLTNLEHLVQRFWQNRAFVPGIMQANKGGGIEQESSSAEDSGVEDEFDQEASHTPRVSLKPVKDGGDDGGDGDDGKDASRTHSYTHTAPCPHFDCVPGPCKKSRPESKGNILVSPVEISDKSLLSVHTSVHTHPQEDDEVIEIQQPEECEERNSILPSIITDLGTDGDVPVTQTVKRVEKTGFLEDQEDSSLFSVFSQASRTAEFEISVVSLEVDRSHSAIEEIISRAQSDISAFGRLRSLPVTHNAKRFDQSLEVPLYIIFQSLLESGTEKNDAFANIKVPVFVAISQASQASWYKGVEVNGVNSLVLPYILNRHFIFLDLGRIGVKDYYHVTPKLECTVYKDLEEIQPLIGPKTGLPVFVALSPGYIYFFYDNKTDSLFWSRARVLMQKLATAYSGELVSFKEQPRLLCGNGIQRLVPTYQGVMMQSFEPGELLNSFSGYIDFIATVGNEIASENKKLFVARAPDPDLPKYLTTTTPVFMHQSDSATKQQYLVDTTALTEKHSDWLAASLVIKEYATNSESNFAFLDIQEKLQKIQAEYRAEKSKRLQAKMFHVLSEIPFNDKLREIAKLILKLERWLNRVKSLNEKDYGKVAIDQAEPEKRLKLGLSALGQFDKHYERSVNYLDVGIVQLEDNAMTSLELFRQYAAQYINEMEKIIQYKSNNDNTDEWEVYEAVVEKLVFHSGPKKPLSPVPDDPEDMMPWILKNIKLESYNEHDSAMLTYNAHVLHGLLKTTTANLASAIMHSLSAVRTGAAEGSYLQDSVDIWSYLVTELHQQLYPATQLSSEVYQRFRLYLPVLKEEVLGRLWSDTAEIGIKLKSTLLAISKPVVAQLKGDQAPDTTVALSSRMLAIIKQDLSVEVTGRGLALKAQGGGLAEISSPLLREATFKSTTSPKTPLKLLTDVINQPPGKFNEYWGEKRKEGIALEKDGYWQRKDEADNQAVVDDYMRRYFPELCKKRTDSWIQDFN